MNLKQKAIQAALQDNWEEAAKINKDILKTNPQDAQALNRLANAYLKIGAHEKAKKTYRQVLKIDPLNLIAQRNLEKIQNLKKPLKKKKRLFSSSYIEEPGKTKTIELVKLASNKELAQVEVGEGLSLVPKKRSLSFVDEEKQYLGALPDDISKRLLHLIKRGNRYEAFVKLVEKNRLVIFIRETFQSKRNQNLVSFPIEGDNYLNFV